MSESEIVALSSTASYRVSYSKHPLSQKFVDCDVPVGMTLADAFQVDFEHLAITVDGVRITAEDYETLLPQADSAVIVSLIPEDDTGIAQILATVAISLASFGVGTIFGGLNTLGGALAASATFAVGNFLLSSLIAPPQADTAPLSPDRRNSITGTRNQFEPYGTVPIVYGRHRLYPPYAAKPYTEIIGTEQYFNALFAVTLGDCFIDELKIGETDLNTFNGVEVTQSKAPDWLNIDETAVGITLEEPTAPGSPISQSVQTTELNSACASVDFSCPGGLLYVNSKGERRFVKIDFTIEFREVGGGAWTNARTYTQGGQDWISFTLGNNEILGTPTGLTNVGVGPITVSPRNSTDFRVSGKTLTAQRFGIKIRFPTAAQYEIRVTRTYMEQDVAFNGTQGELDKYVQNFQWTVIRSYDESVQALSLNDDVTYLRVRIRASDQLNGVIDQLNCRVQRLLPLWNGSAFTAPAATRAPAWAFLDVLMGPGNAKPISQADAPNKIELAAMLSWVTATAANEQYFDRVFDQQTSVFEALQLVASAGRASWGLKDAQHTVVREPLSLVPTQMFTNRNSRNSQGVRRFDDIPHALRIRFIDETQGYVENEITIYDTGFDDLSATRFETLDLDGIVTRDHAVREGWYYLAAAKLRRETFTREVDFENLASVRGDVVTVQDDVSLISVGVGRIVGLNGSQITLDTKFVLESPKEYTVSIRSVNASGDVVVNDVNLVETYTETNVLQGNTLPPEVAVGDLLTMYEVTVGRVDMLITAIEALDNLTARVTMVDLAPAVQNRDLESIPTVVPQITLPTPPEQLPPPVPVITAITSDGNTQVILPSGELVPRMIIAFRLASTQDFGSELVEARIRVQQTDGEAPWQRVPPVGAQSGSIEVLDVEVDFTYEVQIRSISAFGVPSDWSAQIVHQIGTSSQAPEAPLNLQVLKDSVEGYIVTTDVSNLDIRNAERLEFVTSDVNDRDDAGAITLTYPAPQSLDGIDEVEWRTNDPDLFDQYTWVRVIDRFGNAGAWYTDDSLDGVPEALTSDTSEKIRSVIVRGDIRNYGAIAGGVFDNTAAILAAAAVNKEVIFRDGIWLSGPIDVSLFPETRFVGEGFEKSRMLLASGSGGELFGALGKEVDGIVIEGMALDCNAAVHQSGGTSPNASVCGIRIGDNNQGGDTSRRIHLRDLLSTGASAHGIIVSRAEDWSVRDSRVEDWETGFGVAGFRGCVGGRILSCYATTDSLVASTGFILDDRSTASTTPERCDDNSMIGNIVDGQDALSTAFNVPGARNLTISGNIAKRPRVVGFNFDSSEPDTVPFDTLTRTVATGNSVEGITNTAPDAAAYLIAGSHLSIGDCAANDCESNGVLFWNDNNAAVVPYNVNLHDCPLENVAKSNGAAVTVEAGRKISIHHMPISAPGRYGVRVLPQADVIDLTLDKVEVDQPGLDAFELRSDLGALTGTVVEGCKATRVPAGRAAFRFQKGTAAFDDLQLRLNKARDESGGATFGYQFVAATDINGIVMTDAELDVTTQITGVPTDKVTHEWGNSWNPRVTFGATVPATGTVGDIHYYQPATAGGQLGAVYTAAGWKDFGSIAA
ncbi:MAG: host specificity factor TipJ family phage tail protein [Pseudomonadota bacterium]